MSYRHYLEAQKKYIETKKEALRLKEEKKKNPRPPRVDPPPARPYPLFFLGALAFFLICFGFYRLLPRPAPAITNGEPVLAICASVLEFQTLKNWLEPEILANNLSWELEHIPKRAQLRQALAAARPPDLLIIEEEEAAELYAYGFLAPLQAKKEAPSWAASFAALLPAQPFQKTLGWAIPQRGDLQAAQHLLVVLARFAQPFSL